MEKRIIGRNVLLLLTIMVGMILIGRLNAYSNELIRIGAFGGDYNKLQILLWMRLLFNIIVYMGIAFLTTKLKFTSTKERILLAVIVVVMIICGLFMMNPIMGFPYTVLERPISLAPLYYVLGSVIFMKAEGMNQ